MIENMKRFERAEDHENVTVCVCDLSKGFCWWDENGERHDEDGFRMPEMKLFKGDVQELFNGTERSAGWLSMYQD